LEKLIGIAPVGFEVPVYSIVTELPRKNL